MHRLNFLSCVAGVVVVCGLAASQVLPAAPFPAISAEALALHDRIVTLDTHFDSAASLRRPGWSVMERHTWAENFSQVDYPRLVEGKIDGGFWTLFTSQGPRTPEGHAAARDTALQIALRLHTMVARHHEYFEMATRADDAARIKAAGKQIVYLSIENGYPIGTDLSLVRTFYDLGVRMFGPVHFANNELADSSTDPKGPEWGGLSTLGKELVAECNRLGIVLDASHAHDLVLEQLLELSATPIILSHSGCAAVYAHPRNISDDLLRKLAAQGGVIQMNVFSTYVAELPQDPARNVAMRNLFTAIGGRGALSTPEGYAAFIEKRRALENEFPMPLATSDQFMAHVFHALEVVGPDHIGISGDFDGGGGAEGLMDVADLPRITTALLAAGVSEADIEKIWSGNTLRVLRAAEEHAARLAAGN
jgi:membrane dipeptidase